MTATATLNPAAEDVLDELLAMTVGETITRCGITVVRDTDTIRVWPAWSTAPTVYPVTLAAAAAAAIGRMCEGGDA